MSEYSATPFPPELPGARLGPRPEVVGILCHMTGAGETVQNV